MEAYCPQCGAQLQANTPCQQCAVVEAGAAGWQGAGAAPQPSRPVEQQVIVRAHELWSKVQQAGIAKVGLGLMAGSAIFYPWSSQRGIWAARWIELLFMLVLAGYMGYREFTGKDPLPQKYWWAAGPFR